MSDDEDIGYAAVGFFAGFFFFFDGFKKLYRKRLIENTPTSTVRGLAMGLVELQGAAYRDQPLKSPLSDMDCAFYRYHIERWHDTGKRGHWVTVAKGRSEEPFWLEDETGRILVYPRGADLIMPVDYEIETGAFGKTPDGIRRFTAAKGITPGGRMRFREWFVMPKEHVYVLGMTRKLEPAPGQTGGDNATGICIGCGSKRDTFLISDESQAKITKDLSWQMILGIWGGPLMSVACLVWFLLRVVYWK